MAPARDSRPPSIHSPKSTPGCGTSPATICGTKKMPPPMTFETTIAAASSGPSRAWRAVERAGALVEFALLVMVTPLTIAGGGGCRSALLHRDGEPAEEDRVQPRVGRDGLDVVRRHGDVVRRDQAARAHERQQRLQVARVAFLVRVEQHEVDRALDLLHVLVRVTDDHAHQGADTCFLEVLPGLFGAAGIDLEGG